MLLVGVYYANDSLPDKSGHSKGVILILSIKIECIKSLLDVRIHINEYPTPK